MYIIDWALFPPEDDDQGSEKVTIAVDGVIKSTINYELSIVSEMEIGFPGWAILIEAYAETERPGIPFSEYLLPDVSEEVIDEIREFGLILKDYGTDAVISFDPATEQA